METDSITVLGASGWIGSALVSNLKVHNRSVRAVDRNNLDQWLLDDHNHECVIYAIGLTSDFRFRPYDTVEAHVTLISRILQLHGLESLLYLSSTRVYGRSPEAFEETATPCLSADPSDLYNISKLMGESLVLQDNRPGMKVARLSNVIGPSQPTSTFIGDLLRQGKNDGKVVIYQSPYIAKDYIGLNDVIKLLPLVASTGVHRLYNIGRGRNVFHYQVASWLQSFGFDVQFLNQDHESLNFSPLVINRLLGEFPSPGDPFKQNLFLPSS